METEQNHKKGLLDCLPKNLSDVITRAGLKESQLYEIRLRTGHGLMIDTKTGEHLLSETGEKVWKEEKSFLVTLPLITDTLERLTGYSVYSFEEELRQGFFTIRGGHRIGVAGQAIMEQGCVVRMGYITFLNIRVAHECTDCGKTIIPFLKQKERPCHTLIFSPPGCGKTTMLRDLIRLFSEDGFHVGVADERFELSASYLGVPQLSLGRRTDVMTGCHKAEAMQMLLRSMTPEILAADEIYSREDEIAVRTAGNSGCKVFVSAHGGSLAELAGNPVFSRLMKQGFFERFLLLQRDKNTFLPPRVFDKEGKELTSWSGSRL